MRTVLFLLRWVRRLPAWFTTLFIFFNSIYILLVAQIVKAGGVSTITGFLTKFFALPPIPAFAGLALTLRVFAEGLVIVLIMLFGILLSYNLAALSYQRLRRRAAPIPVTVHEPVGGTGTRLDRFERIGIILAGGGAKGAYQAGAMKAIHEFLEANNALGRVCMIAGTSIGSWNAMFWLAGLVKAEGGPSTHEAWWRAIDLARILEFDSYWPMRGNHFVLPTPWREGFRQVFGAHPDVRARLEALFSGTADPAPIHFYFTRSNVGRGILEFATNWAGVASLKRPKLKTMVPDEMESIVPPDRYEVIGAGTLDDSIARTERAVFASMDLPPLFPYAQIKLDMNEYFEDGGVVENLPLWFGTQVENCDLLFVLPLNASFSESVNETSLAQRLTRVMDVRQGVIERNAMKQTYLFNELAALRNKVELLGSEATRVSRAGQERLEARALKREHKLLSVFAICPQPPLGIGTTEFWKPKEAGDAFDLMYAATKYELNEHFEEGTNPNWIRMTLVNPQGERTYVDDF